MLSAVQGDRKGRIANMPRFCTGLAFAQAVKNMHVGRNRFAYYTTASQGIPWYSRGGACPRPEAALSG